MLKIYKPDLLINITKVLSNKLEDCDECKNYFGYIENLILNNKDECKINYDNYLEYKSMLKNIVSHLTKEHGYVTKSYYVNLFMIYGMIIGTGIGTALGKLALGPGFGMSIGIVIGSLLDANAKKKGIVI